MKIVNIQYIGPVKMCIMNTGIGVETDSIEGEASIGKTVELVNDRYTVTSGGEEICEV